MNFPPNFLDFIFIHSPLFPLLDDIKEQLKEQLDGEKEPGETNFSVVINIFPRLIILPD